jgi:hypothetical protein
MSRNEAGETVFSLSFPQDRRSTLKETNLLSLNKLSIYLNAFVSVIRLILISLSINSVSEEYRKGSAIRIVLIIIRWYTFNAL